MPKVKELKEARDLLHSINGLLQAANPKHKRTLALAATKMEEVIHRLQDHEEEIRDSVD